MSDVAARKVAWAGAGIAGGVLAAIAAVFLLLHAWGTSPAADRLPEQPRAAPGLSSAPQEELAQERERQQRRLHSAGWVDEANGIAHIPIEDAMDILARGGKGAAR